MRELGAERDVRDRHILEHEIEPPCALHQVLPDQSRDLRGVFRALATCPRSSKLLRWPTHHLALGDQLTRVELRDDALQHLIDDRGEHALVIVGAELAVAGRRGHVAGGQRRVRRMSQT